MNVAVSWLGGRSPRHAAVWRRHRASNAMTAMTRLAEQNRAALLPATRALAELAAMGLPSADTGRGAFLHEALRRRLPPTYHARHGLRVGGQS
jgi:hypothetical protein